MAIDEDVAVEIARAVNQGRISIDIAARGLIALDDELDDDAMLAELFRADELE